MRRDRVCLGVIVGAHGLRGQVRIKSFTERPEDLASYGPLGDRAGERSFRLTLTGEGKGVILARIDGVTGREAAEALKGQELYVAREALPEPDEEETWYHADLIGLSAVDPDGRDLGRVAALYDYGAGDLIEIVPRDKGGTAPLVLPFTKAVVPEIDLAAGRLVVVVPEETVAERPDGGPTDVEPTGEASTGASPGASAGTKGER